MNTAVETYDEPPIPQNTLQSMTKDEIAAKVEYYRGIIAKGQQISIQTNENAVRLLQQLRFRAVSENPRATKAAKEKIKAQQPAFDLSKFMPGAK